MRTKTVALAAGTALALTTLGGVAVAVPALQAATTTTATEVDEETDERKASRATKIAEKLAGLVEDGTITQEQADKVAATLAEAKPGGGHGPGGHGGRGVGFGNLLHQGLATAATTLGLEEDALRERLRDGETLGEVADAEGVGRDDLVAALVAEAEEALAERVEAGDITQERADEITDGLTERLTDALDRSFERGNGNGMGRGNGFGPGGPKGGDSTEDDETDS